MKWLLVAAILVCLAGVMAAEREALSNDDCYPCWDSFIDCDDKDCCEKVRRKDCRKCDRWQPGYEACMNRFKSRPKNDYIEYLRYRFHKLVEDEMDKFNE